MSSVTIRSLKKSYGALTIIPGIDLDIESGEFVALVGPSGCGKSTLLRTIAGLEAITAGEILIDGKRVNDVRPKDRNIAMVFQSYALYPQMTVAENMGFNLKLAGKSRQEIAARVNEVARMLALETLMDRKPAQLSGGQRQRVAMGRAIVRHPNVFLFDEPLSNLDAKLRVQMRSEIKQLHQDIRTTSIYVTHDQVEAMTLADKLVVLNKGNIEQQGSPMELYERPANLFVASFIGSPAMNFLNGRARIADGKAIMEMRDGMTVNLMPEIRVRDGQELVLGVRPEHMNAPTGEFLIPGRVRLIEPTGAQTHVMLSVSDQMLTIVIDGTFKDRVGDPFTARVARERLYVFDKETGKALM